MERLNSEHLEGEGFDNMFNSSTDSVIQQAVICLLSIRHILLDIKNELRGKDDDSIK